ncbi:MAG: argininosuccinate lyase, partial [Muribaculaceae bacterium]|nr:argininosuccinate lyase [Muribaculaceae bacterium]
RYEFMYSVEEVNRLVMSGVPFRDAYVKVGREIEHGEFRANREIHHTHAGSIGNLCNDRITALMNDTLASFDFDKWHRAVDSLLEK